MGSCGLPCLNPDSPFPHSGCVDVETVLSNVEASFEHPLVGAIVERRVKVADRLKRLEQRQVAKMENEALQLRAASNSEVIKNNHLIEPF